MGCSNLDHILNCRIIFVYEAICLAYSLEVHLSPLFHVILGHLMYFDFFERQPFFRFFVLCF